MENKEVVTVKPRSARRRFSAQFKRELVEQALRSDVSLSAVALANGINANQLARWRRLYLRDEAPGGTGAGGGERDDVAAHACLRAKRCEHATWRDRTASRRYMHGCAG